MKHPLPSLSPAPTTAPSKKTKRGRGGQAAAAEAAEAAAPPTAAPPAEATTLWVQCERPTCSKWRKVPQTAETDSTAPGGLENFICTDNIWDAARATCAAAEEKFSDADEVRVKGKGSV